jgi:CRP-like cAMP-binding protein
MADEITGRGDEQPRTRTARPRWPARSLLANLPEPSLRRLLDIGTLRRFPEAGRTVLREGEDGALVVLLLSGVVKARGHSSDGNERLLAIRMGGDLVGELAVFDGHPRSASVITASVVTARLASRAEFLDCLDRDPRLWRAVCAAISGKVRSANELRLDFAGYDGLTRVIRVLYSIAIMYGEQVGDRVWLPPALTQPELAGLAGTSEPTAHRALRELRAAGIAATGYRRVTVLDLPRLRQRAGR